MRVDEELRQGLQRLVTMVGTQIAQGAPVGQVLQALEAETAAVQPVVEVFRRADAGAWLQAQAKALKPRLPRGTLQRADLGDPKALTLMAEREARWAAEGRDAQGRKRPSARRREREIA
jgi:hypothetical protein